MKTLLRIDSSMRHTGSYSRTIGDYLASRWSDKNPGASIIVRDLQASPIPHLTQPVADAFFNPNLEKQHRALSDELLQEIKNSHELLITCPMYNFQIPSALKAYIDHIVRVNETFQYVTNGHRGLLPDKPTFLITTMGGRKINPTGLEDHQNYLKRILGFIGIKNITTLCIEGTADQQYADQSVTAAKERIDQLMSES
jgi:FMN-dependent NADH-azoreductase